MKKKNLYTKLICLYTTDVLQNELDPFESL